VTALRVTNAIPGSNANSPSQPAADARQQDRSQRLGQAVTPAWPSAALVSELRQASPPPGTPNIRSSARQTDKDANKIAAHIGGSARSYLTLSTLATVLQL
jgi:hypothetical protein